MTNKKDMVVTDKRLKEYGVSTLDPVIKPTDTTEFKNKSARSFEKTLTSKMEELKREYDNLVDNYNINKMVLDSEIRFDPKQGSLYHLYKREDNKKFLSIISPEEWNLGKTDRGFIHIASVRLNSENQWEKL
jgi:hypothetical protein